MQHAAQRLGIDLGSSNVKLSLLGADGSERQSLCAASRGQPLRALEDALVALAREQGEARPVQTAVTGIAQQLLAGCALTRAVNEIVAAATAVRAGYPAARSVIDLGSQLSKWIVLPGPGDSGAVAEFGTNGLCAAGSGAFLEQQACRLQLSVAELGQLAAAAPRAVPIAGRCSVFAKSDMIHQQQQGTPTEEISFGVCLALARTFLSTTLAGRRLEPPVVLVGGGAANPGLVRAFGEELGLAREQVLVPSDPLLMTARGAALLAGEAPPCRLAALLAAVRSAQQAAAIRPVVSLLPPLRAAGDEGGRTEDPPARAGLLEAYLGVDVGSVSTNLVLLSREAEVLQGIYLATRGQPVAVLNEGLALIRARHGDRLRVIGVGTTGSGRHLAARVLGADAVHNEITAQLLSATHCVPDVDTVFEIGGQDSKYIAVRERRLVDFEMNKICAAGTGSFLEEQADRLGVRIVGEFSRLALDARAPVDLGTRCTVFMDAELVRAQQQGAARADLCAGLAYSVARNYLDKVVAGRPVGRRIVFQGGTASNAAVVAAFRQLLGAQVTVHPYNRISGAIGAGLLAARAHAASGYRTRFHGLAACARPSVRSFECQRCENRCEVSRIRLGDRVVHFGDTCERYTERDRELVAAPRPFGELFATRARLLEAHTSERLAGAAGQVPIGVPRASLNLELLPLWTAFLRELGYEPVLSGRTGSRMLSQRGGGVPAEVCAPVKVAAAHIRDLLERGAVERVFAPAVLECERPPGDAEAATCLYTQQIGDMTRSALGPGVIAPQVLLREAGLGGAALSLELARALDRSPRAVARALERGRALQDAFTAARQAAGRAALAAIGDLAVVVIGRPYALHDPFVNLSLARHLDRAGLPAIPLDMLPVADVPLGPRWDTVPWHFSRQQLRAVEILRRDPRLVPLIVSCFGCGVDGFVIKHLEDLLSDRPRLILEFDEHRAEAGLVTRLEAFADEIHEFRQLRCPARPARRPPPGASHRAPGHRFFVPDIGYVAGIYAAALRSGGGEAILLPPADEETVRIGEEHASGRECHPWIILAGELVRWLRGHRAAPGDVFVTPGCVTPCLMRQYGDAFRSLIERADLPRVPVWDVYAGPLEGYFGTPQALRFYGALLSADVLYILATRLRPYERSPGLCDALLAQGLQRIAAAVAARRDAGSALELSLRELWQTARTGDPGDRPVVGVTGDLYTRLHPLGNAELFARLEAMGCEVWPSPYFIDLFDLSAHLDLRNTLRRIEPTGLYRGLKYATCLQVRRSIVRRLPERVRSLVLEPAPGQMLRIARPLLGARTNFLVVNAVAKLVDFLERGATGAITAAGLNCMVGVSATAALPVIRARCAHAPLLSLVYGGAEGPAQRIRLETFVHQVKARAAGPTRNHGHATSGAGGARRRAPSCNDD